MLRKMIMITIYLFVGYQAQATYTPIIDRAPASEALREVQNEKSSICMINAGDIGKLKYKGSYQEAFSKVTNECFQRRTQKYVQRENMHPDQDRQIQFAESCVNSIKCI